MAALIRQRPSYFSYFVFSLESGYRWSWVNCSYRLSYRDLMGSHA